MPDFSATLYDTVTDAPAITRSNDIFTIEDKSNYTTNTEDGHAEADFQSHIKIVITQPSGAVWTLSPFAADDQVIVTPDSTTHSFTFTRTEGDGVYTFKLMVVPTWLMGESYQLTADFVYNPTDGLIYQSLTNNIGQQPDTSPADWVLSSEALLPGKYADTQQLGVNCELVDCETDAMQAALCSTQDNNCFNPCTDTNVMKMIRTNLLKETITIDISNGNFDAAQTKFNAAAKICNC